MSSRRSRRGGRSVARSASIAAARGGSAGTSPWPRRAPKRSSRERTRRSAPLGHEQLVGDEERVVAVEGEALQLVVVDVVGQHLLLPPVDLLAALQGWHPGSSTIRAMAPSTVSPAGTTAPADPVGATRWPRRSTCRTGSGPTPGRPPTAPARSSPVPASARRRAPSRSGPWPGRCRALDRPHDAVGEARRAAATGAPGRARPTGGGGPHHAVPGAVPGRPGPGRPRGDRAGRGRGDRAHRAPRVGPARHPARAAGPPGGGAGPLQRGPGR